MFIIHEQLAKKQPIIHIIKYKRAVGAGAPQGDNSKFLGFNSGGKLYVHALHG